MTRGDPASGRATGLAVGTGVLVGSGVGMMEVSEAAVGLSDPMIGVVVAEGLAGLVVDLMVGAKVGAGVTMGVGARVGLGAGVGVGVGMLFSINLGSKKMAAAARVMMVIMAAAMMRGKRLWPEGSSLGRVWLETSETVVGAGVVAAFWPT